MSRWGPWGPADDSRGGFDVVSIKDRRRFLDMTQEDVARAAGISIQNERRLERKEVENPNLQTVYGVSRALGVDPHEIDEFRVAIARFEEAGVRLAGQTIPTGSTAEVRGESPAVPPVAQAKKDYRNLRGEELRRVLRDEYGVELPTHEEAKEEAEAATDKPREEGGFYPNAEFFAAVTVAVGRQIEARLAAQQQEIVERLEVIDERLKRDVQQDDRR